MANDFGKPGRAWAEAEYERTDLEAVIQDLLTGQYSNPIRVVAFNTDCSGIAPRRGVACRHMDCDAGERACLDDAYRAVKRTITELRKNVQRQKLAYLERCEESKPPNLQQRRPQKKAQAIKASAPRSDSSVPLLADREGWRLDRGLLPRQGKQPRGSDQHEDAGDHDGEEDLVHFRQCGRRGGVPVQPWRSALRADLKPVRRRPTSVAAAAQLFA